ncbi:hypothetical protein I4U23_012283 [Adineta vaga]|nr:hypothetical protein I4U23_012283 [Adineta vaga]
MIYFVIYCLILPIIPVNLRQIPYIDNVFLKPGYTSNSTIFNNRTIAECLCASSLSYPVINWFPNNTCQIFYAFPPTYQIETNVGARLYFPQKIYPNASLCCMPDLNYLLNKLQLATLTLANISNPREMIIDQFGFLVTVEMSLNYLRRVDAVTLNTISRTSIQNSYQMSIAYNQGTYFIAPNNAATMAAIDSANLTTLSNITMTTVKDPRGIIFLNNGQTMVVTSNKNQTLLFFNRTSLLPVTYAYTYSQIVQYDSPHGMWYVNDSYFYVTSYNTKSLYGYSKNNTNGKWNEALIVNMSTLTSTGGTTSMTIDECGRFWIPQETNTVFIFSQQGVLLGNYTTPGFSVSFMKIIDNYIMYLSDCGNNQIMRVNPNIQC